MMTDPIINEDYRQYTINDEVVTKEAYIEYLKNRPYTPERICDAGEVDLQKLMPCPFCGGQFLSVIDGSTYRWWTVQCEECDATCGDCNRRGEEAPAALIKAWNTQDGIEPGIVNKTEVMSPNSITLSVNRIEYLRFDDAGMHVRGVLVDSD
jgi:hypothetical protein